MQIIKKKSGLIARFRHYGYHLSAGLTALIISCSMASDAHAMANNTIRGGIGEMLNNLFVSFAGVPQLLDIVAYVAGISFGIGGIFKLQHHAEQPHQVPIKDGLMRLVAGAMLVALPWVLNVMLETAGGSGQMQIKLVRPSFMSNN